MKTDDGNLLFIHGDYVVEVDKNAVVTMRPLSVVCVDKPKKNDVHPTMKPVELIERCLTFSALPGSIGGDACGGSGSTLIAAERLGLCARVMELSPVYCDVIINRWQNFTGKKAELIR